MDTIMLDRFCRQTDQGIHIDPQNSFDTDQNMFVSCQRMLGACLVSIKLWCRQKNLFWRESSKRTCAVCLWCARKKAQPQGFYGGQDKTIRTHLPLYQVHLPQTNTVSCYKSYLHVIFSFVETVPERC